MSVIKNIVRFVSLFALQLVLALWILTAVLVMVLGKPEPIKNTLSQGGAYEQVIDFTLENIQVDENKSDLPLDTATLKELVKQIFPSDKIQSYTENFINGIYSWLEQETDQPDFRIDLREDKKLLAEAVANKTIEKYEALPRCKTAPQPPYELKNATCLPAGFNLKNERNKIADEIKKAEFLGDGVFTVGDLSSKNGESFTEANKELPSKFADFKKLPLLLGLLALILATLIFFTSETKRKGLKTLSKALLGAGGIVLLGAILFGLILPEAIQKNMGDSDAPLAGLLKEFIKLVGVALIKASGLIVVLGISLIAAEHYMPRQDKKPFAPTTTPRK